MSDLERRIKRLEERLHYSSLRGGSVFNRIEMYDELRELRSELRCRRKLGYSDYDDDISKDLEKHEKKQSAMQRIFDCFKKKK